MKNVLSIVVDVSGSMNEMGKIHLQRNLCRYATQLQAIDQIKYSGVDIRFFQWAENISEIIAQNDGDMPALTPASSSDLVSLSRFLSVPNNGRMLRALILSDGNFESSDISSFQEQMKKSPNPILLRIVAIGADASLLKLENISSNKHAYLSENIHAAIDSAIWGTDKPVLAPETTSQVKLTQPVESG